MVKLTSYKETKDSWRDIFYAMIVQREAVKAHALRMTRKIRIAGW